MATEKQVRLTLEELRADVIGEGACFATPFGARRLTYADHIASGRPLASIEEALARAVLPLYANTHTEDSATGAHTTELTESARAYLKRRLGGGERHKLIFAGTGATGALKRLQEVLGVSVAPHLRDKVVGMLEPHDRWVVFVGPYEHHSNDVSWRESLAERVPIPLARDGTLDLAALRRALSDPRYLNRPRLGSFSAASNVTGLLTDVRAVAKLLHEHGALAAFDFAASAPYVQIDVGESAPGANDGLDAVVLSPTSSSAARAPRGCSSSTSRCTRSVARRRPAAARSPSSTAISSATSPTWRRGRTPARPASCRSSAPPWPSA